MADTATRYEFTITRTARIMVYAPGDMSEDDVRAIIFADDHLDDSIDDVQRDTYMPDLSIEDVRGSNGGAPEVYRVNDARDGLVDEDVDWIEGQPIAAEDDEDVDE